MTEHRKATTTNVLRLILDYAKVEISGTEEKRGEYKENKNAVGKSERVNGCQGGGKRVESLKGIDSESIEKTFHFFFIRISDSFFSSSVPFRNIFLGHWHVDDKHGRNK